jgi:hypothetical protein
LQQEPAQEPISTNDAAAHGVCIAADAPVAAVGTETHRNEQSAAHQQQAAPATAAAAPPSSIAAADAAGVPNTQAGGAITLPVTDAGDTAAGVPAPEASSRAI